MVQKKIKYISYVKTRKKTKIKFYKNGSITLMTLVGEAGALFPTFHYADFLMFLTIISFYGEYNRY